MDTVLSFGVLGGLMPDADLSVELRKRLGKSLGVALLLDTTPWLDHDLSLRRALDGASDPAHVDPTFTSHPPADGAALADAAPRSRDDWSPTTFGKIVLVP